MKELIVVVLASLCAFKSAGAPFQNLDFEGANTTNLSNKFVIPLSGGGFISGGVGSTTDLLPGWKLFDVTGNSTNEIITIGLNSSARGAAFLSSYDPEFPFQGTYAIHIDLDTTHTIRMEQKGDVPAGAVALTFIDEIGVLPEVSIDGVTLSHSPAFPPFIYDISQFAGRNVTLQFTSQVPDTLIQFGGLTIFDNISFIIPAPLLVESDFNGDGAPDLVFEHPEGFVGVWFMNKGPDLISASLFNPQAVADPRWHIVGAGNFTKTNKTDLIFQHEDGSLAVWSLEGTNLISAALLNPSQPGNGWKVSGTGDMNHDGQKDIVFQHTDGTLAVWFMNGINLVQGALLNPNKPGDSGWRVVGTAALSSVGNTDLIFQHSDGTLAAWYMNGTNLVQGVLLNPSVPNQPGWRVATTLDLNKDGQTDLLFQHDDGTVAVWLMDGINLISGQFLNPANPGSRWRIAGPR